MVTNTKFESLCLFYCVLSTQFVASPFHSQTSQVVRPTSPKRTTSEDGKVECLPYQWNLTGSKLWVYQGVFWPITRSLSTFFNRLLTCATNSCGWITRAIVGAIFYFSKNGFWYFKRSLEQSLEILNTRARLCQGVLIRAVHAHTRTTHIDFPESSSSLFSPLTLILVAIICISYRLTMILSTRISL